MGNSSKYCSYSSKQRYIEARAIFCFACLLLLACFACHDAWLAGRRRFVSLCRSATDCGKNAAALATVLVGVRGKNPSNPQTGGMRREVTGGPWRLIIIALLFLYSIVNWNSSIVI